MTGFSPGLGWVKAPFAEAVKRTDGQEVLTYRDTEGKYHYWMKQPQYRDWTVLVKVGGMEEPTNYYLKTPWEWCIRMGNGTWGACAPGWYPPDGCEVLSGGPL